MTSRRSTWYCLVHLDVLLSCQLGKCPLTPSNYKTPLPPTTGIDEWELSRSESVDSLRKLYNASYVSPVAPNAFGFITPARTLSTFNQTISLISICHRILTVINSTNAQNIEVLSTTSDELERFRAQLADMEITDISLSSVPQHRVDLLLLWYHIKLVFVRN